MGLTPYYCRHSTSEPKNGTIPTDYETDVRKISKADVANAIGMYLVLYRVSRGLDQRTVAELVGISQGRLGEYERAERIPSIVTLIAFANLYECTVEDLLGRNLIKVKEKKKK